MHKVMPQYDRLLNVEGFKSSAFIFGPRMTGKTSLLQKLPNARFYNLLEPSTELRLRINPEIFRDEINAMPAGSTVIIDEIQKLPELLDLVQLGIEQYGIRFLLSGSSARKLKRGASNLLGGRALDLRLHPLTHLEIGESFSILQALSFGTLPRIYSLGSEGGNDEEVRLLLSSYYTTYLKEEIQAEAILRNLAGFQRFLPIAGAADGRTIEYSNIARDCSVPPSTVKDFFTILEDTLIGHLLWPWDHSERKKVRPKFYLFDCGITRMLLNRLKDPPTGQELGLLFESWFVNEMRRLKDYLFKGDSLSFWREGDDEVDLLVHSGPEFRLAIEIKSGEIREDGLKSVRKFKARFPDVPIVVASLKDVSARVSESGVKIVPWRDAARFFVEHSR